MAISIFFVSLTQMLVKAKLKGLGTKHCELTSRSNKQLAAYQHSHPERLGQISKIWKFSLRRQQKSPVVMRTKGAKSPVLVFYCCGNNHKCGSLKNRYYLTVMQKSEWSHWDKIDVSGVALEALGKNPFLSSSSFWWPPHSVCAGTLLRSSRPASSYLSLLHLHIAFSSCVSVFFPSVSYKDMISVMSF